MQKNRAFLLATLLSILAVTLFAAPAAAQAPGQPGQPQVTVNGNVVVASWAPPTSGGPVAQYFLHATYNGALIPGSPFNVGTLTAVSAGPLPVGSYTIQVVASNASGSTASAATTFTIGSGVPPGVPTLAVPVVVGSTVGLQWSAVPNATGYELAAVVQATGQTLVFPVGNQTSFVVTQVPTGTYLVSVRATNAFGASAFSTQQSVVVAGLSLPGVPTLFAPVVSGSTVTLNWAAPTSGGAPTSYEIEAFIQSTGQTITVPVPASQTSVTVPGVPPGNFVVRIRARNVLGAGPFSGQQIVVVGVTLTSGDVVVTLIWNSGADMDLHVIEPDGSHVYFANRTGTSAELDADQIPSTGDPSGPEHIFVQPGQALAGVYQFYIVHYAVNVPTTSTIAVTLYPGTPNERTGFFTRVTGAGDPDTGFNVANVDIGNGTIVETTGTRGSPDERPAWLTVGKKQ